MKNNKVKIILGTIVLAGIAIYFLIPKAPAPTPPKVAQPIVEMEPEPEPEPIQPAVASVEPVKTAIKPANPPSQVKGVSVYKVVPRFPEQHFFDDQLCDLHQVRQNLQPMRDEALERLGEEYQHSYYQLSDYIELNLYAHKTSDYFIEQLIERVSALHIYYIKLMGQSAKQPVTINMVLAPKRSEYLKQVTHYSQQLVNSLGVYFGGLNLAYVDYQKSDHKALRTAVHESVHVLNAHILGKTPYMFNEGMAELFEDMFVKEGLIEIDTEAKKITKQSYPVMEFFDDEQWPFLETQQLYYSSWMWYSFMSSDRQKQKALTHFMRQERKDPCKSFNADESYSIFQEGYSMFEYEFNEWQDVLPEY